MTLTQIRAFLAAYEHRSFTAAAREMQITQASMSELVARLEAEVGIKLFTRGSRRLVPTPAGDEFRHHAQTAANGVDDGIDALRAMTSLQGGTSTFGVMRNAAYYDMADLVLRFHRRYPNVKVRLLGLNSALVAESISAGEIECGVIVLPVTVDNLIVEPLVKDEVLYVSSVRDRRAGPVTIEEFAGASLVLYDAYSGWRDPTRRQLLERANIAGVKLEADIEVEHVETAMTLVASSAGDSIVSRTVLQSGVFPKNLRAFPFAEPLHDTLAIARRDGGHLSPATRKFAALARRTLIDSAKTLVERTTAP